MTTGFGHSHITDGHDQSGFIGMFENKVCLETLAEKVPGEKVPGEKMPGEKVPGEGDNNKGPVFRAFHCVVCSPLPIDN